jgi:uncharacterized protein (TIGR03086 family)
MPELLDYPKIAAAFDARVQAVPTDAWDNPSPCEQWKARDVVAHVAGGHRHFLSLLGDDAPPPPADTGNPTTDWSSAHADMMVALADPALVSKVVTTPFGQMPFGAFVGMIAAADTLVHTWDLARAAGLDESLDPESVRITYDNLKPMDGMIRGEGMFKPAVPAPEDADAQTEMLCFCGRTI